MARDPAKLVESEDGQPLGLPAEMLPRPWPAGASAPPPRQAPRGSAIIVGRKPSTQPEAPVSGSLKLRSTL
eukprot:15462542-Alexandrium_andersonii.AAC.1